MIQERVEFLGDPGEESFLQALEGIGKTRQHLERHLLQRIGDGEHITLFIPPPRTVQTYCAGFSTALLIDQVWISPNGLTRRGHLLLDATSTTNHEIHRYRTTETAMAELPDQPLSGPTHTPVLDTEALALSRRFGLPLGAARDMVRLLLARLDHTTLRALRIETVQADAVSARQAPPGQMNVGETARQLALGLRELHPQVQILKYTVDEHSGSFAHAELLINAEAEVLGDMEARARQEEVAGFLRNWPANRLAPFNAAPGLIHLSRLDGLAAESEPPLVCEARR